MPVRLGFRTLGFLLGAVASGCVGSVDVAPHRGAADAGPGLSDARSNSPVGSVTEEIACSRYAHAYCELANRCIGASWFECVSPPYCPDRYFSPGSTYTVDDLLACASEADNYPCSEFVAGHVPRCDHPGTRANGEACTFDAQCASYSCDGYPGHCGVCADPPKAPKTCERSAPGRNDAGDYPCPTILAVGQPCLVDSGPVACIDGAFCSKQGVCETLPKLGERCGVGSSNEPHCAPLTVCFDGRCAPPAKLGEPCNSQPGDAVPCEGAARCGCAPGDCTQNVCLPIFLPGEPCTARYECINGNDCVRGVCTPSDPKPIFESACGRDG